MLCGDLLGVFAFVWLWLCACIVVPVVFWFVLVVASPTGSFGYGWVLIWWFCVFTLVGWDWFDGCWVIDC